MLSESGREALERTVAEIEVLEAIYGAADDDDDKCYDNNGGASMIRVVNRKAFDEARAFLAQEEVGSSTQFIVEEFHIVIQLPLDVADDDDDDNVTQPSATLHCRLSCGYPICSEAFVSVDIPSLQRSHQEPLSKQLQQCALDVRGEEALLTVVQRLQEIAPEAMLEQRRQQTLESENTSTSCRVDSSTLALERRWLFMDHIKAETRRSQMIQEANDYSIGGFIKPGYPGVCVVEGAVDKVNDYVAWVKNIWIGRVAIRGQVVMDDVSSEQELDAQRKLPIPMKDLGNRKASVNMGALGSECRAVELEDEFLEFIMQIQPSTT